MITEFDGDETPIIRGSALAAAEGRDDEIGADKIMELMAACDEHIPGKKIRKLILF